MGKCFVSFVASKPIFGPIQPDPASFCTLMRADFIFVLNIELIFRPRGDSAEINLMLAINSLTAVDYHGGSDYYRCFCRLIIMIIKISRTHCVPQTGWWMWGSYFSKQHNHNTLISNEPIEKPNR